MIKAISTVVSIAVGWLIIVPISLIVPKRRHILYIEDEGFTGNIKYQFLHHYLNHDEGYQAYYLTYSKKVYCEIKNDVPVLYHISFESIVCLLQASVVVVSSEGWQRLLCYYLCFRAKKIQLWHAAGVKKVGLEVEVMRHNRSIYRIYCMLTGRYPEYDLFLFNSMRQYTTRKHCFRFRMHFIAMNPRNEVLFRTPTFHDLLWTDTPVIEAAREHRLKNKYLILFAPTFRENDGLLDETAYIDFKKLSSAAGTNDWVFIVKLHTFSEQRRIEYENVIFYDKSRDVYPLLSYVDLLITDYSSIFSDFMLTGKPIILYLKDYEQYAGKERGLQMDIRRLFGSLVCTGQKRLMDTILNIRKGNQKIEYQKMISLFFDEMDMKASEMIYQAILERLN
jgi:CDP-glycerol glycerophosphotransferase